MKKTLPMLLTLAMLLTLFAGCGTTAAPKPEPVDNPTSDVVEVVPVSTPTTVEGIVKEASLSKIVVTLADGTDLTLDTTGITDLDVGLDDTVKVEYTDNVANSVTIIEKAEPELPTTTVTGVVAKIENNYYLLTMEDGTDGTLSSKGLEGYGIEVGDTLAIKYIDDGSGDDMTVVSIELTKSEKTDDEVSAPAPDTVPPTQASPSSGASSGNAGTPASQSGTGSSVSSGGNTAGATQTRPHATQPTTNIVRDNEEVYAWYQTATDLGIFISWDNLNPFLEGKDVYPCGTDLYNAYLNYYMNKWNGIEDWGNVHMDKNGNRIGSGGTVYTDYDEDDDYYYYDDDDDEDVPAVSSSSSGSSESKSQSGRTEGSGDVYEVIRLVNAERSKAGLPELEVDSELMAMAAVRAEETAVLRGHTRPDGRNFDSILTDFGWNVAQYYTAENIAYGQTTASKVVNDWMNSSGHKANILKSTVTKIGLAFYYDSDSEWGNYWVMLATSD